MSSFMAIGGMVFGIGCLAGFFVGFLCGDGAEHFFKYKIRLAEIKAEQEERIEDYIKKQRGGKE